MCILLCRFRCNGSSYKLRRTFSLKHRSRKNVANKEDSLVATKVATILTEECKLTNVLHFPNLRKSLLFINKIEQSGFEGNFESIKLTVYRSRNVIKKGYKKNNPYDVKFVINELIAQKTYQKAMKYGIC